jgi:hypothetical protein
MGSYVERKLASQDKRFQAALDEANALLGIHEASRGAEFEDEARSTVARFLPYTYQLHGGFLRPVAGLKKQLDVIIRSRFLPEFWQEVPVELITVAGEVKTTLDDKARDDYLATAAKLASAAALAGRHGPLPFFMLAGALKRSTGHAAWLASLVSNASAAAVSAPGLWPAAFSFDEREPMSAILVGPLALLRAVTADGEELDGVLSVTAGQLSPSAMCYLWLWACLPSSGGVPDMELGYMRDAVYRELSAARGLAASYRPGGENGDMRAVTVTLLFTGGARAAAAPVGYLSPLDESYPPGEREASLEDEPPSGEPSHRRFMLISLGPWVEEPETWDESLWGGSGTAKRRGARLLRGHDRPGTARRQPPVLAVPARFQEMGGHWLCPRRPRRDRSRGSADHQDHWAALGQVRLPGLHSERPQDRQRVDRPGRARPAEPGHDHRIVSKRQRP